MKNYIYFCLFLTLFIVSTFDTHAQFTGYGDDQRYQSGIRLPQDSPYPPLYADMPLRVSKAYTYMYAQNRNYPTDTLWNYYHSLGVDSLRKYASAHFAINNYDPKLIHSIMHQSYYWGIPNDTIKSYPERFYYGIIHSIIQKEKEFGEKYLFMLYSDYIFKARVDSVVIGFDTTYGQPIPHVIASFTIIDNILGNKTPCNTKIHDFSNTWDFSNDSARPDKFNICYPKDWITNVGFASQPTEETSTITTVKKGDIYYLFLMQVFLRDYVTTLFPINNFEQSGGLFPVTNGKVTDKENFWGLGNNVDEADFTNNLKKLKSEIESWYDDNLSIENSSGNLDFTVSPNPVYDGRELNIRINMEKSDNVKLSLCDIYGREVLESKNIYLNEGLNTFNIHLSKELNSGIYFIKLNSDNRITLKKIVIIK